MIYREEEKDLYREGERYNITGRERGRKRRKREREGGRVEGEN